MKLLKELIVLRDGIISYQVAKKIVLKLGYLYEIINKLNNNKFYYSIKSNKININNKLFIKIKNYMLNFNTHDVITLRQEIKLTNRIINKILNTNGYHYNRRYHSNPNNCLIYLFYLLIKLFSERLYKIISFNAHIFLITYLFSLNNGNSELIKYLLELGEGDLHYLLEYKK